MLLILVVAAWVFWMRLTQPVGTAASETPTSGVATPAPPTDAFGRPRVPTPPPALAQDEVWLGNVSVDAAALVAAGTPLNDVVASGVDITSGPDGIVAAYLEVTATVPYSVVEAELPAGTTVGPAGGGEVRIRSAVEVLGRELAVAANGAVHVVGGKIVVDPTAIDLGGPDWLSELLADITREIVTFEHEIEGLPEGLVLQKVVVQDDGFRATLVGADVTITGTED
ncbi:MAG TPA: LmeA family phospholipid-binding protein [Actinomycetales bacterium]|nr:LmeA family phospholipid-binding protein [Actinomycetales bacterium]